MDTILGFLSFIFWLAVFLAVVLGFLAFRGYNGLRLKSENVKEAWSNIGVTVRKQVSLINQLINVVSSYAEGERLVMLKISDDSSMKNVQQVHQQSGVLLSAVSNMAQRFPDLKANTQYTSLMSAIREVENQLEHQRQKYNSATKEYNVLRTSIPAVFYSKFLGFGPAPYLDFDGASEKDGGTLQQFVTDDGQHLNQMLANVGNKAIAVTQQVGNSALTQGKQLVAAAQAKAEELSSQNGQARNTAAAASASAAPYDEDATVVTGGVAGPQLLDVGGTAGGKTFSITAKGIVIGRSPTSDIQVQDNHVSKQHVWIGQEEGRWLVKDQNSANGTFVDGDMANRITVLELRPGIVLSLGNQGGTKFQVM